MLEVGRKWWIFRVRGSAVVPVVAETANASPSATAHNRRNMDSLPSFMGGTLAHPMAQGKRRDMMRIGKQRI
ncbi:hypothetical protein JCM17960_04670 [Magnetospira thiophila]